MFKEMRQTYPLNVVWVVRIQISCKDLKAHYIKREAIYKRVLWLFECSYPMDHSKPDYLQQKSVSRVKTLKMRKHWVNAGKEALC